MKTHSYHIFQFMMLYKSEHENSMLCEELKSGINNRKKEKIGLSLMLYILDTIFIMLQNIYILNKCCFF